MIRPTYDAMLLLFAHAQSHLTTEELRSLSQLSEHASTEALRLGDVLEGVGCLVDADEDIGGAGSFRDKQGAADLLWSIRHHLEAIAGMALVGSEASFLLRERLLRREDITI
ncbi:hypothetical protein [Thauera sp. WB-2]|uniref:hypothetical protein n=1 Tax=Thauera sp. WB-2 TaxID=2897772 RepID=UPI0022DCFC0E|nr:hypothetical protein [Thauera sp. WB-2]WBL64756.1 hypothetical protein LQF09_02710 [Thauera sp. WB-2]